MKKYKTYFFALLICMLNNNLHAKSPKSNPYKDFYKTKKHWTEQINWRNLINFKNIPNGINAKFEVDSAIFLQAMNKISKDKNGGIIYFPKGVYYFNFQIRLLDKIIIRGDDPIGNPNAKSEKYILPTKFIFPTYKFDQYKYKIGLPNSSAFKKIYAGKNVHSNFGLVNLDIDGAIIDFSSKTSHEGANFKCAHSGIILLGLRINNAAIPNEQIPTEQQLKFNNGWQRWPSDTANIIVMFNEKCVISNCKINDYSVGNFNQYGYKLNTGINIDGNQAQFRYTNHPAIFIELIRSKNYFFAGLEIKDNLIYVDDVNEHIVSNIENLDSTNNTLRFIKNPNIIKNGTKLISNFDKEYYFEHTKYDDGVYINHANDSLPYKLVLPQYYKSSESYPLILFFHDDNESGKDNIIQLRHFIWNFVSPEIKSKHPCFILAPQKPILPDTSDEFKWVDTRPVNVSWKLSSSIKIMENIQKMYNIDKNKIYVIGLGAGGNAAIDATVRFPKKFAASIPISSFYEVTQQRSNLISQTPTWFIYGDKDETIPLIFIRLMLYNLNAFNNKNYKLTEIKNSGHYCWNQLANIQELIEWLFNQKK